MNSCNNKSILFSIIVPIYKKEENQVRKCIDSLINQQYRNIEIVLVDDGNEFKLSKICDEYRKNDKRIKVVHQENKGVSNARNSGIRVSNGDYIIFVDADDWIDNQCCKVINDILIKENYEIIAWAYTKEFYNNNQKINFYRKTLLFDEEKNKLEFDKYNMKLIGFSTMKAYSKELITNNYFNENLTNGEDVEFNFRIFKNAHKILYLNYNWYHYRIQKNSAVRRYNPNIIEYYDKTLLEIKKNINKNLQQEKNFYYSFLAICFLMICLNYIFNNKNRYIKNRKKLKNLLNRKQYKDMIKNIKMIKLPITRKMAIIFSKFHLYFFVYLIMKVKERMDNE